MFTAPLRAQYPTNLKYALSTQLNALLLVLKDNLNISFEEWDSFRHYIVPFWDELIKNYKKDPNIEIYNSKLLSAYYLLGVSIGLDKFEK